MGAVIHISKAKARGVSLGLISCFIFGNWIEGAKVRKMRKRVVGTGQFHQSEHHGEGDEQRQPFLDLHGLGEEL
jgi:hypothetical protein